MIEKETAINVSFKRGVQISICGDNFCIVKCGDRGRCEALITHEDWINNNGKSVPELIGEILTLCVKTTRCALNNDKEAQNEFNPEGLNFKELDIFSAEDISFAVAELKKRNLFSSKLLKK